jgi:hypothetical protein
MKEDIVFGYVCITSFLLILQIYYEGILSHGGMSIMIFISLLRESKIYNGYIYEILLSAVVVCFTNISPIMIVHIIDRLSYLLVNIYVKSEKMKTLNPGDVVVFRKLMLVLFSSVKLFWVIMMVGFPIKLGNPSLLTRLLLYDVFIGSWYIGI